MLTAKDMERLMADMLMCWECDNAPKFEDSQYCESCHYEIVGGDL